MKKTNTNMFYSNPKTHSDSHGNHKVPASIFRQELVTWQYTEDGIKRTTITRNFSNGKHTDSYTSEPISLKKSLTVNK